MKMATSISKIGLIGALCGVAILGLLHILDLDLTGEGLFSQLLTLLLVPGLIAGIAVSKNVHDPSTIAYVLVNGVWFGFLGGIVGFLIAVIRKRRKV